MSEASEIFTTPSPLTSAEEKQVNSPIPTIHKAMVKHHLYLFLHRY